MYNQQESHDNAAACKQIEYDQQEAAYEKEQRRLMDTLDALQAMREEQEKK